MSDTEKSIQDCRINPQRLMHRLHELARIGQNDQGGINRQLASPADGEARQWLVDCWQQELGLDVKLDAIANLWGIASNPSRLPPIVIGSHHDTVPDGGAFDGALGVLMATEVLQTLQENHVKLRHPVQLVSFTGEEPNDFSVSTLGSKVLCGRLGAVDLAKMQHRLTGESLGHAIQRLGGDIQAAADARLHRGQIAAFLECHIEQGRRLFERHKSVAAVTCITGIYREIIVVNGEANHAGTTRPADRQDALTAAAEIILAAEAIMRMPDLTDVALTIGHIEVEPNASNIIPGEVRLSLDLRTAFTPKRQQALQKLNSFIEDIQQRRYIRIDRLPDLDQPEMPMDSQIIQAVNDAMDSLGEPRQELVSMAGHDAANMARITKAGMLFVQSIDGYSHCPRERTNDTDIARTAQVMLQTIGLIDRRLNE